ncbi:MAG: tail fiber domain-containing protein [Amaricoccus sp.]|uniref:tail fiber domain-containing protein n=1 Tax=Amaricoccus sp. TaxID=1872485 RepID=UPI0039E6C3F5
MGLEAASKISQLNAAWPLGTDPRSQGDDHLRLIKSVMKADALSKDDGGIMAGGLSFGEGISLNFPDATGVQRQALRAAAGVLTLGNASFTSQQINGVWSFNTFNGSFLNLTGNLSVGGTTTLTGTATTSTLGTPSYSSAADAAGYQMAAGIGTLSVSAVSTAGAATNTIQTFYGGANVFAVRRTGNVLNANNSYGALSDERLKQDIADATPKLADLLKLRIVNFSLSDDPEHQKQIGVIAQEARAVFPALVEADEDGTLSFKYSVLVPILVKAVQELAAQVEQLKAA